MFPRRRLQWTRPGRLSQVSDDWIRALPREKSEIFESIVHHWECSFAMTSVALDDAISTRARGGLVCAAPQVELSAVLLGRLSVSLVSFCDFLVARARYIPEAPAVEPLNAEFFRGDTCRTAANRNALLHRVVFGERLRFVNKMKILAETIAQLDREFRRAVKQISETTQSSASWKTLDWLHYDFNTCLRETEIVLKSFLRVLSADQLAAFTVEVQKPSARGPSLRPRFSRAPA